MSSRMSGSRICLFRDHHEAIEASSEADFTLPAIVMDDFDLDPHKASDVEEPSSPFKLRYSREICSSPSFSRSGVQDLRTLNLNSSPSTPKTLVRRGNLRRTLPSTEAATTSRSSNVSSSCSLRGIKRSQLTPRVANVNPFTPNGALLYQSGIKRKRYKYHGSFSLTKDSASSDSLGLLLTDADEGSENENPFSLEGSSEPEIVNQTDGNNRRSVSPSTAAIASGGATSSLHHNYNNVVLGGGDDHIPSISRYIQDFIEIEKIGSGDFGCVFKCVNRLDGCVYAIKQSRKPLKGSSSEKRALNEVYAHAVLGKHTRVVHYFSAWAEEDRMFIQNEFCAGGSLAAVLETLRKKNLIMPEYQAKRILLHVSQGLKYIHSQSLAHMDIKPDNIFLTKKLDVNSLKESSSHSHHNLSSYSHHNRSVHSLAEGDDGFEEHDLTYDSDSDDCPEAEACYKIGDLGLLTHAFGREVEEGDCRYMAPELLNEETEKDLTKTDIYALGMTLIEILSGKSLPKNGNEWHEIRKSSSPLSLPSTSPALCRLIQRMIDLDPSKRPTAAFIVQQPEVRLSCEKTKAQLKRELNSSIQKIKELEEQLNKRSTSSI